MRLPSRNLKLVVNIFFFLSLILSNLSAFSKERGGTLVIGMGAGVRTLIPILASDSASAEVCSFIFNGLLKYDKDLKLKGDLAESWEIKDGGRTLIFHLRRGVKWQDGVEFSAQDVIFTYQKLVDPRVPTPYSGDFKRISAIKALDKYTVEVKYAHPFAPALASWTMSIIPKHLLEDKDLSKLRFWENPIGTGPYELVRWKHQQLIELRANKNYFEHPPFIERVIFRIIPDSATLFLEVLSQAVDNASLTPLQYVVNAKSALFRKNFLKFRLPSNSFIYLGYNLENPLFSNKKVRRALNFAVDKEKIVKSIYHSQALVSNGPFTPQSWAYSESLKPASYSLEKARRLLEEAGWQDRDGDGILEKEGKKLRFTITTNQGSFLRQKIAEIIQHQLKKVGVGVDIKVVEWSVFIERVINQRNFDAVLLGWSLSFDPDLYDIFYSKKTARGEFNFVGYNNPEVDKLLLAGRRTFDREKRKAIYTQVARLIYEDQPYMFIAVPYSLSCLHRRFRGVKPARSGYFYNFIDWWVEKQERKYMF